MMTDDMLFIIDGLLGQVAMGKTFYEQQKITTLPLDAMFAQLTTARALVLAEAEAEAADAPQMGDCPHPQDKVTKQVVGGGNYYLLCRACNEIIEQS